MSVLTCGFIGLGLIGGSLAKALKAADASIRILAFDADRDTLSLAVNEGIVDMAANGIDQTFSLCDYLFLCAPVSCNEENLSAIKSILSPDCLLTDVGSVKSTTHAKITKLGLDAQFIGGHPMAGSERTGYANASPRLLENAYYILTPTPEVSSHKVAAYEALVNKMGAIPLILSPSQHDFVTAAISHLPHVAAAALVNLVQTSDSAEGTMRQVAAGGFKDITRIASSSPAMWRQICLSNPHNLSKLLDAYIESLQAVKTALNTQDGETLFTFFDTARTYRDSFSSASHGPIKRIYDLSLDIADRPGALAHAATLLAEAEISIKNIGITHNREIEEGSMRIEFPDEASQLRARTLLEQAGYTVYISRI